MVRKLVRLLGMGLLALGIVALVTAFMAIRGRRERQAAEMAEFAEPGLVRHFQISDMWDFENMHGADKALVQIGAAMTVAGAACLALQRALPREEEKPSDAARE